MTTERDEDMLDGALAQMLAATPADLTPSEDLLNRIMMDADDVLAQSAVAPATARPSFGAMLLDLVGGWPSLGGLAAATVAGLWIGVVQPAALTDLSTSLWGGTIEVPVLDTDVFAGLEG